MPGELAYTASKGALEVFTRQLAAEVAHLGITVNAVGPGPNDTGWIDDALRAELLPRFPAGRLGEPEDAARVIAWLCSPEAAGSQARSSTPRAASCAHERRHRHRGPARRRPRGDLGARRGHGRRVAAPPRRRAARPARGAGGVRRARVDVRDPAPAPVGQPGRRGPLRRGRPRGPPARAGGAGPPRRARAADPRAARRLARVACHGGRARRGHGAAWSSAATSWSSSRSRTSSSSRWRSTSAASR